MHRTPRMSPRRMTAAAGVAAAAAVVLSGGGPAQAAPVQGLPVQAAAAPGHGPRHCPGDGQRRRCGPWCCGCGCRPGPRVGGADGPVGEAAGWADQAR